MSRCFPYPGYLRQGLVESIKPASEKILSRTEQKLHKRREKKQEKKESKRKDKAQGLTKGFKILDDSLNVNKDDQSENSDLTEEHEAPVCYTSDGSQNSNKRKRETLFLDECRVDGNIVKKRFSSKKPREPDASLSEPYESFIEDWMPPPLIELNNDDNGDLWFLKTKHQEQPSAKTSKLDNGVTWRGGATLCSCARFLSDAEIFALPYTIPF
ncbi:hypothetical protein V6N13_143870 [Hibiscus sabdariffa]|uniref:Uncharacterized protein n=1 Tax=Hibiscus sabdariffa TaxID=183260 RepID=A0ABR2FIQ7_9ROSI